MRLRRCNVHYSSVGARLTLVVAWKGLCKPLSQPGINLRPSSSPHRHVPGHAVCTLNPDHPKHFAPRSLTMTANPTAPFSNHPGPVAQNEPSQKDELCKRCANIDYKHNSAFVCPREREDHFGSRHPREKPVHVHSAVCFTLN